VFGTGMVRHVPSEYLWDAFAMVLRFDTVSGCHGFGAGAAFDGYKLADPKKPVLVENLSVQLHPRLCPSSPQARGNPGFFSSWRVQKITPGQPNPRTERTGN
jgi:hypothetical protein